MQNARMKKVDVVKKYEEDYVFFNASVKENFTEYYLALRTMCRFILWHFIIFKYVYFSKIIFIILSLAVDELKIYW